MPEQRKMTKPERARHSMQVLQDSKPALPKKPELPPKMQAQTQTKPPQTVEPKTQAPAHLGKVHHQKGIHTS
jgi:hypothetical protein